MSPRLAAKKRMMIGLQVINLAFDRDGISVEAAAEELNTTPAVVEAAVGPFTDLEYVHESRGLLDDIGQVVTLQDGWIAVQQNWLHDLTSLDPGDAALLLAMIETAGEIDGVDIGALRTLRRRLDALSHVLVREPVPPAVADLVASKHRGIVISARYEGSDMRVARKPTLYEVHEVRWTPQGWQALVTLYGKAGTNAFGVFAEHLHDIQLTSRVFERRSLTMPDDVSGSKLLEVELEFPTDRRWLLRYFDLEIISENDDMAVGRIQIDPRRALSRLLVRLGPDARIGDPDWLADAGRDAAMRILELYRQDSDE